MLNLALQRFLVVASDLAGHLTFYKAKNDTFVRILIYTRRTDQAPVTRFPLIRITFPLQAVLAARGLEVRPGKLRREGD